MRRWVLSAALCALLTLPVWGQRGGGGHGGMGGGGHGFSGGGFASHGGGYSYHGGAGYARGGYGGVYGGYGYGGRGYGYGYGGRGYGGYGYRGYGWGRGWGWGYPWWGWGYAGWGWYPWWGWGGGYWDNSYYNYYPTDTYPVQGYPTYAYPPPDGSSQDQTQDQINSLKGDQLRSQQNSGQSTTAEIRAETVLVYRDGHTEQVQSYAIVGKTIWIFDESRARKIALSELDLPATRRDNEDRGIEFVLPSSSR